MPFKLFGSLCFCLPYLLLAVAIEVYRLLKLLSAFWFVPVVLLRFRRLVSGFRQGIIGVSIGYRLGLWFVFRV